MTTQAVVSEIEETPYISLGYRIIGAMSAKTAHSPSGMQRIILIFYHFVFNFSVVTFFLFFNLVIRHLFSRKT